MTLPKDERPESRCLPRESPEFPRAASGKPLNNQALVGAAGSVAAVGIGFYDQGGDRFEHSSAIGQVQGLVQGGLSVGYPEAPM